MADRLALIPATAKRVSMFEAHADMLCKRNQICFGHKVCLAFGKTGVVLAADILRGNPADVTLATATVEQINELAGQLQGVGRGQTLTATVNRLNAALTNFTNELQTP